MKRIAFLLLGLAPLADAGDFEKLLERAQSGDPAAQLEAAEAYSTGEGVAKDVTEAVRLLELAASQGIAAAQLKLGTMFLAGDGVPRNAVTAAKWYKMAAEKGETTAQLQLARMHLSGAGGMNDPAEAWMWATLASKTGDLSARRVLETLRPKMNAATMADGEARVTDFLARNQPVPSETGVPPEAPPLPEIDPDPAAQD